MKTLLNLLSGADGQAEVRDNRDIRRLAESSLRWRAVDYVMGVAAVMLIGAVGKGDVAF